MKKIWVIPDLHSNNDLLIKALDFIGDIKQKEHVVFLGDYIDRGSQSFELVETLIKYKEKYPKNTTFLRGNHEDFLIKAFAFDGIQRVLQEQEINFKMWLANGGIATAHSYVDHDTSGVVPFIQDRVSFKKIFPTSHIKFFVGTEKYKIIDNFWFVHGGCSPHKPLREQDPNILYWDRGLHKFMTSNHLDNKKEFDLWKQVIVTGHSGPTPIRHSNYYMLDGGAPRRLIIGEMKGGKFYEITQGKELPEDYNFIEQKFLGDETINWKE